MFFIVVYSYNGILHSNERDQSTDTHSCCMDESHRCYTERQKPGTKESLLNVKSKNRKIIFPYRRQVDGNPQEGEGGGKQEGNL